MSKCPYFLAMQFNRRFQPYRYVKTGLKKAVSDETRTKAKRMKVRVNRGMGYFCLSLAFSGSLVLLSPWLIAESILLLNRVQRGLNADAFSQDRPQFNIKVIVPTPMPTPDPATLPFSIQIPKIAVDSKVIANVDAGNPTIYKEALKQGVAHALDSGFPGQERMIYIFGHSTDYPWNVATYNALFYQLKDLTEGDEIKLKHGETTYKYFVKKVYIVENDDLTVLKENEDRDVLILQTCYPPGTTWKRLLVVAEPGGRENSG